MNNIATAITVNFTSTKMTGLARDGYFFHAGAKIIVIWLLDRNDTT